jgi:hypothetical protein
MEEKLSVNMRGRVMEPNKRHFSDPQADALPVDAVPASPPPPFRFFARGKQASMKQKRKPERCIGAALYFLTPDIIKPICDLPRHICCNKCLLFSGTS